MAPERYGLTVVSDVGYRISPNPSGPTTEEAAMPRPRATSTSASTCYIVPRRRRPLLAAGPAVLSMLDPPAQRLGKGIVPGWSPRAPGPHRLHRRDGEDGTLAPNKDPRALEKLIEACGCMTAGYCVRAAAPDGGAPGAPQKGGAKELKGEQDLWRERSNCLSTRIRGSGSG